MFLNRVGLPRRFVGHQLSHPRYPYIVTVQVFLPVDIRRHTFRQTPTAAVEGTFGMGPGGGTDDVVCGVIDAAPMSEEARIADRDRRAREAELLEWTPDVAGWT